MSTVRSRDKRLYNKDLAPTDKKKKNWGWFEIFNVWANDVQSLFGYTLAASLFLTYGLNGWAVFLAILLAGFFIMWLVTFQELQVSNMEFLIRYLREQVWESLAQTFRQW